MFWMGLFMRRVPEGRWNWCGAFVHIDSLSLGKNKVVLIVRRYMICMLLQGPTAQVSGSWDSCAPDVA